MFFWLDLRDLRLDNNNLSGQIPSEIGFLTDLGKSFASAILAYHQMYTSQQMCACLLYADTLRLSNNFWTGTIPDVFENYERLDFFDISNNRVGGRIPRTIFDIPTIRLVYMHNCSLNGTIPSQYSRPPLLRDLYLNGNLITGPVPPIATGEFELLNELLLHGTQITGTMPDSICDLRLRFILDDLWSDCGGEAPEIDCPFPDCCNRCFESESNRRRAKRESIQV